MNEIWLYTIASTLLISALSFSGALFLTLNTQVLKRLVFILVSFAVGALFGNSFFILVPESYSQFENKQLIGLLLIGGLLLMFILEKFIHWRHNHTLNKTHQHAPMGYVSLVTDSLHNFTDGILIAAAWLSSPEAGAATTLAVILHEVPQEISDFGVLIQAGFSKKRALLMNFLSACTSVLGAVLTLWIGNSIGNVSTYILPLAAGGFIYLAGSDLIPELHKEKSNKKNLLQLSAIVLGLMLMFYISLNHTHDHNPKPNQTEHTDHSDHNH
ncbi:MAG TPA: ZIP family metal transporter [Bacteroidales bacterium]|nr:ZIP family metal transporter [Bacteroidales bacterium]